MKENYYYPSYFLIGGIVMNLHFTVKYKSGGKTVESSETETELYSIETAAQRSRLTVTLIPKKTFELVEFYADFEYRFGSSDRFFAGGYQSWTKTREYTCDDIQRGVIKLANVSKITRHIARIASDEGFVEYSEKPGEFHSHCYTYIRSGEKLKLWGSLDESAGFTYFKVRMNENYFSIHRECERKIVSEPWKALDIVYFEGGYDEVFDKYFAMLPTPETKTGTMSGYTSWYNYFQKIDESIILRDLDGLDRASDEVSIFQIDDGYETFVGDWLDPCDKFPHGMKYIADKIHAKGYKAGIWLAPFSCQRVSKTAKEHPDWLIKDEKGRPQLGCVGWGGAYTLDIYNPQAREYIKRVFDTVLNGWGYDMVKLDFLYSECITPRNGKSRGEIMHDAMKLLRECVGDKLILGCGVPLGAAFGFVDACRISCDVDLVYNGKFFNHIQVCNEILSAQSAINNSVFRRHLNGRVFMNDPDVFFLRNNNLKFTQEQKLLLARINNLCGNVLFVSDNAGDYDEKQLELLKKFFKKTDEKITAAEYVGDDVIAMELESSGERKRFEFNIKEGKVLKDC